MSIVDYGGAVSDGLIIGTDSAGRWMAFGDNWPNRARHWIPSIDHPSDKSTVTFNVRAPSKLTVVANGTLLAETRDAQGRTLTRWREKHPIPVYLFTIAAAPLARYDLPETACGFARDGGCVKQMVYTAPEQAAAMPANFKYSPDIVDFFAHLIAPFPYEKLAHLQSSTRFGGMENASAIFYADGGFRRNGTSAGTIAHETAHQWFGDAVTEREWSNLWLSEGFATYFEQLWTRHAFGDSAFRAELSRTRTQILRGPGRRRAAGDRQRADRSHEAARCQQLPERRLDAAHAAHARRRQRILSRDPHVLQSARRWQRALRRPDARRGADVPGMKLGWFFDQWLRRPGFASLTTSWHYDAAAQRVVLDVEQGAKYAPYRLTLAMTSSTRRARRISFARRSRRSEPRTSCFRSSSKRRPGRSLFDPSVELLAEFHSK